MRQRYTPNLSAMAGLCEANYVRLLKLLPDMEDGLGREFVVTGGPHHSTRIIFTIEEQFKYTRTILIEQTTATSDFLKPPKMEVRFYQDVRMAEVVSFHNDHRFNGVYHYPNPQMRLPDEKNQINHFLADWLQHCLEHGEADISLNFRPHTLKCDSSTGSD